MEEVWLTVAGWMDYKAFECWLAVLWKREIEIMESPRDAESEVYVAAAGVSTRQEMSTCLWKSDKLRSYTLNRRVVGAMLFSPQSLHDRRALAYPNRFPRLEDVSEWISEFDYIDPKVDRQEIHIHYSPSGQSDAVLGDLEQIASALCRIKAVGLQLNASMPSVSAMEAWVDWFPNGRIILPITRRMANSKVSPKELATMLREIYSGLVTDVLLDWSGGQGRLFDPEAALPWLEGLAIHWPEVRLGVAGGFGPVRLSGFQEVQKRLGPVNLDAETNLRDGDDRLVVEQFGHFVTVVGTIDYRLFFEEMAYR